MSVTGYTKAGADAAFPPKDSDWVTSTGYVVGQLVVQAGVVYRCATAHTSGTFATDLAASKWVSVGSGVSAAQAIGYAIVFGGI